LGELGISFAISKDSFLGSYPVSQISPKCYSLS
jgi:hypothetical protein